MDQKTWDQLSPAQKDAARDNSVLTKQLIGREGYRVEVLDNDGNTRRFIVGISTGWQPCHLEIKTIRSHGGLPADSSYQKVTLLGKVR